MNLNLFHRKTKGQRGQALIEALIVAPCILFLLFIFTLGVRVGTTLWLQHQTHAFALCLVDGQSQGYCHSLISKQVAKFAPYIREFRVKADKHSLRAAEFLITSQFQWPRVFQFAGLMPEQDQFEFRLTKKWTSL